MTLQQSNHVSLGFSVYLSTFGEVHPFLKANYTEGASVFTSLHISEEFDDNYVQRVRDMLISLRYIGYKIIADVSKKTMIQFGQNDILALAKELDLWMLRLDYGFSDDEILQLATQIPIAVNASTIDITAACRIRDAGGSLIAFHNFYPRPETGLGDQFFSSHTQKIQAEGIPVYGFIPGDALLRGPVFEGLPTLERHRGVKPSIAYFDLLRRESLDGIFVGDCMISQSELAIIRSFEATGVLQIPALLHEEYKQLYERVFTSRPDSPAGAIRFQESREYSCFGEAIAPENTVERKRGTITLDNLNYGRYSGEVQILLTDQLADSRVNVIGYIAANYDGLLSCVPNGSKFMLVKENGC